MKVTECIEELLENKRYAISFEIIPPERTKTAKGLFELIDGLVRYKPPFIDVTSHAAEIVEVETSGGVQKRIRRKRPGTLGICSAIIQKYGKEGITAIPHVLCRGFTREETEDFLIEARWLGIENVLAIRGDDSGYEKPLHHGRTVNKYAIDLVKQIVALNSGVYLDEDLSLIEKKEENTNNGHINFCIGVAGYPEKHFQAPNLTYDIMRLKEKIDAGARYVVTQMCFDNNKYFEFVRRCKEMGIGENVPIIPGLKIITYRTQLYVLPGEFHITIPEGLADRISSTRSKEESLREGVLWAANQVEELFSNGVPIVHFYIMQNMEPVNMLMEELRNRKLINY